MQTRGAFKGRPGFLLLEALIGFALLALFLGAVGLTVLVSRQGTASAADRARAIALTSRAIEGVRAMRDAGWSSLTEGVHGVAIQAGAWAFSGSTIHTPDGFQTSVTLESVAEDRMTVTAQTDWAHGQGRSGSVLLVQELTNWRSMKEVGDWSAPQLVGSHTVASTPIYNRVAVGGDTAFVTTETSGGGPGLALFDISDPSSPQRIADAFMLSSAAHDLVVAGSTLFVATENAGQEIQIYDVSDPADFSGADLIGFYDLPGDGRARSLALAGDTLVIGAVASETFAELYILDVSDAADPVTLSSLETDGTIHAISIQGSAVYMALSEDTAELRVADIANPEQPQMGSGSGYNLSDTLDALTVAVTGTSAILGRDVGDFIEELAFFDLGTNVIPVTPPGPWYWEIDAVVQHIAVDLTERYAFVATGGTGKELMIIDVPMWREGLSPVLVLLPQATGEGRGLFYDPAEDRLYLVTRRGLFIYRPS